MENQVRLDALNVRMCGDGEKTMIFSHGIGTDRTIWSHLMGLLLEDPTAYTMVVFDLACSPLADPSWYDHRRHMYESIDGYVTDLLGIVDALHLLTPFVYVGDGFAGMVGLVAATLRPNAFSTLFFINSSPRFYNEESYFGGYGRDHLVEMHGRMRDHFEEWLYHYSRRCVRNRSDRLVERVKRYFRNMEHGKLVNAAWVYMEADFRPMLGNLTTPCCIICTADTSTAPPTIPDYIKSRVRGPATVRRLPDGGDLPHLTTPSAIKSIIREHLAT